jgi:hypothetical protein
MSLSFTEKNVIKRLLASLFKIAFCKEQPVAAFLAFIPVSLYDPNIGHRRYRFLPAFGVKQLDSPGTRHFYF